MQKQHKIDSGRPDNVPATHSDFLHKILILVLSIATLFGGALLGYGQSERQREAEHIKFTEDRIQFEGVQDHVEEYFDAVHSLLLYIGNNEDVRNLSHSVRPFVQEAFDYQWESHQLSELRIVERSFDGSHSLQLTFEHGNRDKSVDAVHFLKQDKEENQLLIEQMQAFANNPALEAKVGEATLCIDEPGLIYSLPIYRDGTLTGLVCGMIPKSRLMVELRHGKSSQETAIVNHEFKTVCDIQPGDREWLRKVRQDFKGTHVALVNSVRAVRHPDRGTSFIVPLSIGSADNLFLVYMTSMPLTNSLLYLWGPPLGLTGIGLVLIILVVILRRRHQDNFDHMAASEQIRRRHEGILSTSMDGFWMSNTHGEIFQVNNSFCKLTGYSQEQLLQMKITDLVDPNDSDSFTKLLLGVVQEKFVQLESRFLRKDGSIIEMEMSANYLTLDGGAIFAFVRDISERNRTLAELARHRESLSRAHEIAELGNWEWDIVLDKVTWSEQIYHIYGLGLDTEPSVEAVQRIVHPDDRNRFDEVVGEILASKKRSEPFEFRIVRPDGQVRNVLARIEGTFDDDGKLILTAGTVQDITERKKVEEALEYSERLLRRTVESTADGILVVNDAGKAILTNSRFAQIWQIPDELLQKGDDDELLSHVLHQLIDPEAFISKVKELYGSTKSDLDTLHFKDGRVFERYSAPLVGEGHNLGRVWSFREITDRQQAEDQLREVNRQLISSIDNMPIAYILWDSEKRLQEWNSAAERIFGYTKEEMQGKHPFEVLVPDRLRSHTDQMTRDLLAGEPSAYFERENNLRKDGTLISCRWHNQPLKDDKGNVFAVLSMAEEVTTRIEAEERHRQSEARLRQVTELLPEAIFETDFRGYFTLANQKAYEYFGYNRNDLTRKIHSLKLIAKKDRRQVRENSRQVMAGKVVGPAEVTALRKDGSFFEMILNYTAILKDGNVIGMRGIAVDITSRKQTERDLQKSEQRYREQSNFLQEVIESLSHPFCVIDASNYRILIANSAAGKAKPGQKTTCHLLQFGLTAPCSQSGNICSMEEAVATGKPVCHQRSVKGKDGSTRHIEIHCYPIFDDEGKVTKVIEYSHDITERKRTERDLMRMAEYPESNPSAILTLNKEVDTIYNNPAAMHLLTELKLETRDIRRILPENIDTILSDCIDNGRTAINIEAAYGDRTWLWNFHPAYDPGTVNCFAVEITDRLEKEQESRKLWAAVVQSRNMICITDRQCMIEYINPAFERITGFTSEEAIRNKNIDLNWVKLDTETHRKLLKTISAGDTWQGMIKGNTKDGQSYWERQSISPVLDDHGVIVGYLMVGEDITEETNLQTQLAESDKMSAVGMLAAGVAHEFKNYLAGIMGNASFALDVLDDKSAADDLRQSLSAIVDIGEKANEIAMSLLTYSRASTEEPVEENLVTIIERSIKLVEKEMKNLNIEIVTDLDESLKAVVCAGKIQQLILNLLINALDAIKSNGVICIVLKSDDQWTKIIVADTGCGISESDKRRIFDPFFSTKGLWGKDKVSGTGMGLSICRNIAREFGGTMEVESMVGAGTSMILSLPHSESETTRSNSAYSHRPDGQPQVLLMSLDEQTIQNYIKAAQVCSAGLTVVDSVQNIRQNLRTVADVVIFDTRHCAKLELYRLTDICQQLGVPYVAVNCDISGSELSELYEAALANYKGPGDLQTILERVVSKAPSNARTSS